MGEETIKHWTAEEGSEAAVAYCKDEIAFYGGVFNQNHRRWKHWQTLSIVFGVIGTIAATIQINGAMEVPLIGKIEPEWFALLRALPVAIASIATGMLGSFAYQADALRQGMTSDLLNGELARFLANAAPYDQSKSETRVTDFVNNVRSIINAEQSGWEATLTSQNQKRTREDKS